MEVTPESITSAQLAAASNTFGLLSAPHRLHLVWLLSASEYDVSTLAELTGTNVPATSQHLAKLRAGGIVTSRRDGRRQVYSVNDPHILSMIGQIFSHIAPDGTLAPDGTVENATGQRRPRFE